MSSQTLAQGVSAIGSAGSLLGFAAYVWIMLLNRKDQVPEMRFTDSHGTHWGRDGHGQLHRVENRGVRRRPEHRSGEDTGRDDSDWESAHRERAGAQS